MGSSFTTSTSGPQSTPPAPRETWQQRMSRRSHQRRDPRDPRVGFATRAGPHDLDRAHRDHKRTQASKKRSTSSRPSARARSTASTPGTGPRPEEKRCRYRKKANKQHITCGTRSLS